MNTIYEYSELEKMLLLALPDKKDFHYEILRHVYCDGENIVSTNGRILTVIENCYRLEQGSYDILKNGKDAVWIMNGIRDHYVNYKQIIPEDGFKTTDYCWFYGDKRQEWSSCIYKAMKENDAFISMEYLCKIKKIDLPCHANFHPDKKIWRLSFLLHNSSVQANVYTSCLNLKIA